MISLVIMISLKINVRFSAGSEACRDVRWHVLDSDVSSTLPLLEKGVGRTEWHFYSGFVCTHVMSYCMV